MSSRPLPPTQPEYERPSPLLRVDPDLARNLSHEAVAHLEPRLLVRMVSLTRGRWEAPWLPESDVEGGAETPLGGLLIHEGLLLRAVHVQAEIARREDRAVAVELLGPGDLLRPWQDEEGELLRCSSSWRVYQPARLAVVDRRILRVATNWPEVMEELLARAVRRSRWLTVTTALNTAGTARERLVLSLEHLADQWGRVTPEGIVIALPLTHRLLAQLTGMTRPTCSSALSWLAKRHLVRRRPDGTWWLRSDAREQLARLLAAGEGLE